MENQQSPQTDQDVIDWILENLIEKSRTRRSVIKKLKELGLIFKAPTKRSNALAANKNAFMHEEDEKLRELYDEHRVEPDCLRRIMEVFNKKRSKKAVVKRMVQLGLVADESEILPAKKPRERKTGEERRESSSESDGSSSEDDGPTARPPNKTFALNNRATQGLRIELEESLKEAIDWIVESLKEAAEDFEAPSEDPDDAIPIVPFTEYQKTAMEDEQFKKLLESVNLQAPTGSESYWKIPANMMPADLNLRAKILAGEEVAVEQAVVSTNDSDDDDEDLFERLRAQREALVYNQSDVENEQRSVPLAKTNKRVEKVGKPNTKILQQLLPQVTEKHSEGVEWIKNVLREKAANKSSDAVDEMLLAPSTDAQKGALSDEKFKRLLVAVNLTAPDGIESLWRVPEGLSAKELLHRADLLEMADESSDDEEMVIKRKKKKPQQESDELAINTQELKQRLADLETSSEEEEETMQATRKNVLASSDEEEEEVGKSGEKRKSVKRDRSEISGDTPDENEMNATNNQHKRIRRIADSSDDEWNKGWKQQEQRQHCH